MMQTKGMQKGVVIKTIAAVVFVRLVLYAIFSIFYLWLLDLSGLLQFSWRHVPVLTATIFFIWFFLNNLLSRKTQNAKNI